MKNKIISTVAILLVACGPTKNSGAALYEVLYESAYGGSQIEFYEIISDKNEINMLLNDENLKGKINKKDIQTSNFVILNMGQKSTGGYAIAVSKVIETPTNIVITVKQEMPKERQMVTMALTNPYCIVKINSKKEIVFK